MSSIDRTFNSVQEVRAVTLQLETLIRTAESRGIAIPQETRDKAEAARKTLDEIEAHLVTLKAEETAIMAETWSAFDDAMGKVAEMRMDGDEAFARGDELNANVANSCADILKGAAQRFTHNIVEGA